MIPISERHKLVPASYLVLALDGKALLLRRFNTGYEDGNYSLVAGHVDQGETFTQTMVREAFEEAGIRIRPEDLRVAHIMQRKSHDSERLDMFFVAEKWKGAIENKEPYKCDDLSWFSLEELPDNVIPYVRQALECVRDGRFYSEFGWD
ncbi:MAG: NUDIX domain-containing protein [Candidatus Moraniibacteriota bacterium]